MSSAFDSGTGVAGRVFLIVCITGIAIGTVAIGAMMLAALAFSPHQTIAIPFVATFRGSVDASGSSVMALSGSWVGAVALTAVIAAPMWFYALLYWAHPTPSVGDEGADA